MREASQEKAKQTELLNADPYDIEVSTLAMSVDRKGTEED